MEVKEDFTSTGAVRYTHRRLENMDIYFIANRSNETIATECTFRVDKGEPELWDPVTGQIRSLPQYRHQHGQTVIPIHLDAFQSYFVVFPKQGRGARAPAAQANFMTKKTLLELDGPWNVHFDPEWGGPAEVEFNSLEDWTNRPEEGIRYYSGTASYFKTFEISEPDPSMVLDLGVVNSMARVILNGKNLGVIWTAPWQVDISDAIRTGTNQLEIQVVNLWINRLIGDEFKPDDGVIDGAWPDWLIEGTPRTSGRYTFTTHRYYTRESPLVASGLLGPVIIKGE